MIAVPRLKKYGEHVDDHQLQLVSQFAEMNLICPCLDCAELAACLDKVKNTEYELYTSNTKTYIDEIDNFIKEVMEK